ncbi:hypothetical protein E2C01_098784 [Portunus trituberculatus]|uniref:Uncharacterized protein n=1 Tax=Portunus trituberculatus TaxID=210409 RepID=A0A5B7K7U6_PORTR|nr:hypothetical protein [Portunus trituberculatus]
MSCVDFRDVPEVVSLLQDLDTTLWEFKSHESIENIFIMDQLKNRLKQHQISNTAVCDCHNDNQLSDVGGFYSACTCPASFSLLYQSFIYFHLLHLFYSLCLSLSLSLSLSLLYQSIF